MAMSKAERKDHPRVCGEKCVPAEVDVVKNESPPRVRGEVEAIFCALVIMRITPACAGRRP